VAEVKLEKMDLPGDQRVYVNNPESPTGFEIQPLSATEAKVGTDIHNNLCVLFLCVVNTIFIACLTNCLTRP